MSTPSLTTGRNGTKTNARGPGNPHARAVARLQAKVLELISDDDLRAVVAGLVERAKAGDVAAAREVLTRAVGKPAAAPDPDRLEVEATKIAADQFAQQERYRIHKPSDLESLLGDL